MDFYSIQSGVKISDFLPQALVEAFLCYTPESPKAAEACSRWTSIFSLSVSLCIQLSVSLYVCGGVHVNLFVNSCKTSDKNISCVFCWKGWMNIRPTQPSDFSIRQILTVPCVPPWLPYPPHPSLRTQILVSSATAQIASQQQEKCFLSAGNPTRMWAFSVPSELALSLGHRAPVCSSEAKKGLVTCHRRCI